MIEVDGVDVDMRTAPFDARFPNQNQNKNCWQKFVDFQKCVRAKGEEYEACQRMKRDAIILCPTSWVSGSKQESSKWKKQKEAKERRRKETVIAFSLSSPSFILLFSSISFHFPRF